MFKVLEEFGSEIAKDDPIIVTDRGSNMISAFSGNNNIYCIDHLINNTIQKTVSNIPQLAELVTNCSKLVKYFKKSGINSNMKTSLKSMCPTRWNTVFYLLKSVEENWIEIFQILKERNEDRRIQDINLNDISSITQLLQHFEDASKKLEADKYPTLHLVIPYVHRLKKVCTINQDDTDILKETKLHLIELLQNLVYQNLTVFHKVALFLFPPTNKLIQFEAAEKEEIMHECQKITVELSNTSFQRNQNNVDECGSDELFADFIEVHRPDTLDNRVINEINTYKSINIGISEDFDVIQWWHVHESQFPHLYKTSCKILATPASSASSERAFSAARQLLSEKRCNIVKNLEFLNKIMFLHSNIKEINENFF